jgi:DNA-binding transcriptional ArsR family regulator
LDEFSKDDGSIRPGADIDRAAVPDRLIPARVVPGERTTTDRQRTSRERSRFVKGPLPIGWIASALRSGGTKALPVLLALKHEADATRESWVKPPAAVLLDLGIDRMARSRAIAALERAGLIEVRRRRGRPPLVRLVPWGDSDGS